MGLHNTESVNGYLKALSDDATASSELVVASMTDEYFRNIKGLRGLFKLANLSQSTEADTLYKYFLTEGDSFKIKNSQGLHDFTVGAVTQTDPIIDTNIHDILSNIEKVVEFNSYYFSKLFTNENSQNGYMGEFIYSRDKPFNITSFHFKGAYTGYEVVVSSSDDNINYNELSRISVNQEYQVLNITTEKFKYYKFQCLRDGVVASVGMRAAYLKSTFDSCDTSSVTNGEIPTEVYRIPEVKINNILLPINQLIQSNKLTYITYDNTQLYPTGSLEMSVALKSTNNEMLEFSYQEYSLNLSPSNATLTADDSPNDLVEISGANSENINAFNLFDGDISSDAFSITTDDGATFDLVYKYTFDTPTTIFSIKALFGLSNEAVSSYKVEGSLDDSTYVTLLDIVDQSISIDDYKQVKKLSIDKYDAYKYYRISFTKGCTANDLVNIKQFYLLGET